MSVVELLRFVPVIGGLLPLAMLTAAFGAALLTRFGFYRFVPPDPEVAGEGDPIISSTLLPS